MDEHFRAHDWDWVAGLSATLHDKLTSTAFGPICQLAILEVFVARCLGNVFMASCPAEVFVHAAQR
eukprot:124326-Chlamydomonas_euryale.AAC.2